MRLHLPALLVGLGILATSVAMPLSAQQIQDTAAVRLALSATTTWLGIADAGKAGDTWESGAPAFQAAVTKAAWVKALTQARGPFEPFGTRTILSVKYLESAPDSPPGPYVVVQYLTRVSGNRDVIETVTSMRTPDGAWKVAGYVVRPNR